MTNLYLFESGLAWNAEKVKMDYAAAQRPVSFQHVRAAVGHTLIRLGTTIQGKAREVCEGCTETCPPVAHPTR